LASIRTATYSVVVNMLYLPLYSYFKTNGVVLLIFFTYLSLPCFYSKYNHWDIH